jgi:hypothetical protein
MCVVFVIGFNVDITLIRKFIIIIILTTNGFLPGGSGTAIRHNTKHTPHSNKTVHITTETLHTMNTIKIHFNYNKYNYIYNYYNYNYITTTIIWALIGI